MSESNPEIETNVLIVGTGPAGATTALALSAYGVSNLVINRFPFTARAPRAQITKQRTIAVIRDLGLEYGVLELAAPSELMGENPFLTSLADEELTNGHGRDSLATRELTDMAHLQETTKT